MARPNQMKKIGTLDVIEIPGNAGSPCIVMMHGYGADARDLVSLSNVIKVPAGTTWLFPNGPLKVPIGPGIFGQGWFPIELEALELARASGTHRDYSNATPPGIKQMRESIFNMLKVQNIAMEKVIFAGFSQGAMLATSLALYAPVSPLGLIILSGSILDEKTWTEKAKGRAGMTFYQSHGSMDDLLSLGGAEKLEHVLLSAGLKGKLQIFTGGHEIPQEVIHGVNNYLKPLVK
jgi:phospholipase/carboxylesterase